MGIQEHSEYQQDEHLSDYPRTADITKEMSKLVSQASIAEAAAESLKDNLSQSQRACEALEEELREARNAGNEPDKVKELVEQLHKVRQELVQEKQAKLQGQLALERYTVVDGNLRDKLRRLAESNERKDQDCKRYKKAVALWQEDDGKNKEDKRILEAKVETLTKQLADNESEKGTLEKRKHEMYERLETNKVQLKAALLENGRLADENARLRESLAEVATFAATSLGKDDREEVTMGGLSSFSPSTTNRAIPSFSRRVSSTPLAMPSQARSNTTTPQASRNLTPTRPPTTLTTGSPQTPTNTRQRCSSTARRSRVDPNAETPPRPTEPLKEKEPEELIPGWTKVSEHYRKVHVKKN